MEIVKIEMEWAAEGEGFGERSEEVSRAAYLEIKKALGRYNRPNKWPSKAAISRFNQELAEIGADWKVGNYPYGVHDENLIVTWMIDGEPMMYRLVGDEKKVHVGLFDPQEAHGLLLWVLAREVVRASRMLWPREKARAVFYLAKLCAGFAR